MDICKGVRPLDYVLAARHGHARRPIGYGNVNAGADADLGHKLDSQSWLMIPVCMVAALPILWRRRNILGRHRRLFRGIAASVPMFGWVTRCGFALPLSSRWRAPWRASPAASRTRHRSRRDPRPPIVTWSRTPRPGSGRTRGRRAPRAVFYGIGLFVESRAEKAAAPRLDAEHVHAEGSTDE